MTKEQRSRSYQLSERAHHGRFKATDLAGGFRSTTSVAISLQKSWKTYEEKKKADLTIEVNIDIDWMDPDYTQSLPLRLHDQTSNQIFVDIQLAHPSNRDMFIKTARELKERSWVEIYTRMVRLRIHDHSLCINLG